MKRLLALLLILVMLVSVLASCNKTNNTSDQTEQPTEATNNNDDSNDTNNDNTDDNTDDSTDDSTDDNTDDNTDDSNNENEYPTITVAKALELCGDVGNITKEKYYIRATVVSIDNAQYGAMTIADDTGTISVYNTKGYADMTDKPYKGDEVLLYCILQNYNGTKEVKEAELIEFKKNEAPAVNEGDYVDMSIADAREADAGEKIKIDGVVAAITYANGKIPSGVYLVDNTQSIYVYDSDIAQRAKVGNKITVLGTKTYWILDTEKSNAQKFGYKGCCQLDSATLLSIDNGTYEIDFSWVKEGTVKEILDTPVSENITTSIVKVNALVKKVPGNGFVNYYFFDLDGNTGSYTYTQCNGGDFTWLDQFDNKICTVYLSPINAKSTAADCGFRFFPVKVVDESFKFNLDNTAEHVVKYCGVGQFIASYTGDPAKELETTFSSALLGFTDAVLTFTSDNEDVVYFTTDSGKTVFHCGDAGKSKVTVSCTYNGKTYSEKVEITVTANASYNTVTVAAAKDTAEGTEVILKGIVGPSLVNQVGFYLFDETGMIAVRVDASVFEGLEIGHEIVIKGTRAVSKKDSSNNLGQLCINDGEILANYYGNHSYETFDFIEDKDVEYLYGLEMSDQHSDEVYVITANIVLDTSNSYSHQYKIEANGTKLSLYCSGKHQYSDLLESFVGQEVTLEVAPCDWNSKNYYAFCVLAVRTPDGKVVNQLNFTSN